MTVVGAICGCYIGYSNLDSEWLNMMPDKCFLDYNLDKFLSICGHNS